MGFAIRGRYILGPGTGSEYKIRIHGTSRQISSWADYLLDAVPLLGDSRTVEVVVVSNLDLGFTEEWVKQEQHLPRYKETQEWAQRIGLRIPPVQLALECCVQEFDQPVGEHITVCSQPLPDSCETIKRAAFALGHDAQSSWLLGTPARTISERSLKSLFMFIR